MGEAYKWREFIERIENSAGGKPDRDEPAVGDDLVRVYPVRTRLSRYLSHNSDCVADVLVVVQKDAETNLLPKLRKSLKKHVSKLELDNTAKLLIRVEYERDAKDFVDWLVENESKPLARDLGFGFVSLNMTSR